MNTKLVAFFRSIKGLFNLFLKKRFAYWRKLFIFLPVFVVLLSTSSYVGAQTNGFIMRGNADSVPANIKVYKALFGGVNIDRYQKHVEVEDSTGKIQTIDPTQLSAFSFTYNGKIYQFYSEPIRLRPSEDTAMRFLTAWIKGPKASVYKYESAPTGPTGNIEEYYTFEKAGNKHLYLTSWVKLNTFIEKLTSFYGEFPGIAQLIDDKFAIRKDIERDIKEIIDKINEE